MAGSEHPQFAGQAGHSVDKSCYCPSRNRGSEAVPELNPRPTFSVVGGEDVGVNEPTGLAFRPDRPCELWVVNSGDNSVNIFFNPASSSAETKSSVEKRQDSVRRVASWPASPVAAAVATVPVHLPAKVVVLLCVLTVRLPLHGAAICHRLRRRWSRELQ